ncbi:glycoside hydrolase family 19 protein [Archangium lansingense]|uniref:Glycoside hydrolase family 19 catalytic domain-containing protein n=1 Tax=Archangium lansingense TaxID=2995310 RepID=A0ABT4A814_9BACT|nr:glycoside hydrolase family 19 protein [Archangium lansinium]MCY1077094.1 hypothetical protein [Archangium lansinium]
MQPIAEPVRLLPGDGPRRLRSWPRHGAPPSRRGAESGAAALPYKGRGPIQLTGRNNYRAAGQALGIDLEGNPTRAADVDVGFRTAAWFWNSRSLNPLADQGNFREITRRINGGFNGLAAREAYYARAKQVLGA